MKVEELIHALYPADGLSYMRLEDASRALDPLVGDKETRDRWVYVTAQKCIEAMRNVVLLKARQAQSSAGRDPVESQPEPLLHSKEGLDTETRG